MLLCAVELMPEPTNSASFLFNVDSRREFGMFIVLGFLVLCAGVGNVEAPQYFFKYYFKLFRIFVPLPYLPSDEAIIGS